MSHIVHLYHCVAVLNDLITDLFRGLEVSSAESGYGGFIRSSWSVKMQARGCKEVPRPVYVCEPRPGVGRKTGTRSNGRIVVS